ncbi:hypothetical protein ACVIHH_002066 [Bradyrhizobium sp. USDA 4518]
MHGTPKKATRTRSAVTSGARLFAERLDLRTAHGIRFKDLVSIYILDAGGEGKIKESQRALIRDIALLQCQLEDLQAEYAQSGKFTPKDRVEYQRIANSMRRHMRDVGLTAIKRDDDGDDIDDPLEYARRGGSRHSSRERLE